MMLSRILVAAPVLLLSASAFAQVQDGTPGTPPLSAPGIVGLVAAGVIGAIFAARRKK